MRILALSVKKGVTVDENGCNADIDKDCVTDIEDKCPGCGMCVKACPAQAITSKGKKQAVVLNQDLCIKCRSCFDVCRMGAVKIE